jgi:hypothetical protein
VARVTALLVLVACLLPSCGGEEPTLAYQYIVRGSGDQVAVTFLTDELGLAHRTVRLPWTSEEFQGTRTTPSRLEVEGPAGSSVECVIRYRRLNGDYGANGSGELTEGPGSTNEALTHCSLDQEAFRSS